MESFRIPFVLGLIALSLGLVSGAADTDSIFFRQYLHSIGSHNDVNVKQVDKLSLTADVWTVFLLHGLKESVESDSVKSIANAYLESTNYNVIAIDYRKIADNKIVDREHVHDAAKAIAKAMNQMTNHGLNPTKIHIVGYWLGAQVAAPLGSHTNFRIPRITGLNPAGPKFYEGNEEDFLKSGDAKFVDIIHSDNGNFDQLHNSGDADFHPNGDFNPQPGCRAQAHDPDGPLEKNCNRARSWMYYAESVKNPTGFISIRCTDVNQFNAGKCNRDDVVPMGFATPTNARGKFYLHTHAQSPFAEGIQGIL